MAVPVKDAGKETIEEVKLENESLSQNDEEPGEQEVPVRESNLDSEGACTSNSSFNSRRMPHVFYGWKRDSHSLQWKNVIHNIKKKSSRSLSIIPSLTNNYEISRKHFLKKLSRFYSHEDDDVDIDSPKPSWKTFSYSDLAAATDNFSQENLLGKGGNAEVYKGEFSDGQVVAVKTLRKNEEEEEEEEERASDFLLELGIIAHINHPNAAQLIGFSVDEGLHLVLQFAPHGSLASVLFGSDHCLDWKTRFKVVIGIAEGLKYLHHDCPKRIIHRDITASNILLTEDYDAHISDFGLAKWLPENWPQHVVHPIKGTFGYLAPEYFMHGIVDEKTDVFAFGVLLLEILTGRRAVDSSNQSIVIWGKPLLESNKVKELVDPRLEDNYDPEEVERAMLTASMCINHSADLRPNMIRVVELVKNEDGPVELQQSCGGDAVIVDGCDLKD